MPKIVNITYQEHADRWKNCRDCALGEHARHHVFCRGTKECIWGHSRPDILFIGEAPGRNEDDTGLPFVGPAGEVLDSLIKEALGDHTTYIITNVVCCIPWDKPRDFKDRTFRQPTPREIKTCRNRLEECIYLFTPQAIITLGKVASNGIPKELHELFTIYSLVHPSYILRQGGENSLEYKRRLLELKRYVKEIHAAKEKAKKK